MYKEFYTVVGTENGRPKIDSTTPFKETIIKLVFNWGTCILLGIEEHGNAVKFTFSQVDGKTEDGLIYIHDNPTATEEEKVQNTEVEYFFPCFYYNRNANTLLVRRDYSVLLANLAKVTVSGDYVDLKNAPKIIEYDISSGSGTSNPDLRNLASTTIDTTSAFKGNKKIGEWLNDIITLYNTKIDDEQQLPTFINLKTNKGTIKLITINKKDDNSPYIFEFSSITEINDNGTFEKYQIFFLYNENQNTLQIKQI